MALFLCSKAARLAFHCGAIPLTLNLLTTTIVAPPSNASKWQMGFNSAFKGLIHHFNVFLQDWHLIKPR